MDGPESAAGTVRDRSLRAESDALSRRREVQHEYVGSSGVGDRTGVGFTGEEGGGE